MRLLWCCIIALSSYLASGVISDRGRAQLTRFFGEKIAGWFDRCDADVPAMPTCNVAKLAESIGGIATQVRSDFDVCPRGCPYPQSHCDAFWATTQAGLSALAEQCGPVRDFPDSCRELLVSMNTLLRNPRFDLAVKCSIISPGADRQRLPQCGTFITMLMAATKTLPTCGSVSKPECVHNFCEMYAMIRWWMKPRNLQNLQAPDLFQPSYILVGCEALDLYPFVEDDCPRRRDLNGYCDCLCGVMPQLAAFSPSYVDCQSNIDAYMLFGRLGVSGFTLNQACESPLCRLFGQNNALEQCADAELPSEKVCAAMQLPFVTGPLCPWLRNSGEERIIQCLDGHRCSVDVESWSCCEQHRGRGSCPKDAPVMCDEICSGDTEYCCKATGQCNPRGCSPLLRREPVLVAVTNMTTTSTEPGVVARSGESAVSGVRLPEGSWVWLLLLAPLFVGTGIGLLCKRIRQRQELEARVVPLAKLEEDGNALGGFNVVRRNREEVVKTRPLVCIEVGELPEVRPLGLELVETQVERVHPWGERWGWRVGDVIVDIAGHPVTTFEELWQHIQTERLRAPVRFVVERCDFADNRGRAAPRVRPSADGFAADGAGSGPGGPGGPGPGGPGAARPGPGMVAGAPTERPAGWPQWLGPQTGREADPAKSDAGSDDWGALAEEPPATQWQLEQLAPVVRSNFVQAFEETRVSKLFAQRKPWDPPSEVRWATDASGRAVVAIRR